MSMNARSYDMESREITKRKLYDIAEEMEKITDCKFDLEYVDGYEPIINDPGIVDLVISACRKNMGEDSVKIGEYDEGSDDFSYYMNATGTSGAYFFLLSGHESHENRSRELLVCSYGISELEIIVFELCYLR